MKNSTFFILVAFAAACSTAEPAKPPSESDKSKVALAPKALAKNPITTAPAVKKRLAPDLEIVGAVATDQDHVAIVGPLVPGRVASLRAGLGDTVTAGQVLAEIESTEVGEARAQYLSASARARAANANLQRERDLAAQHISSERERELAEAQAISEDAERRAALEKLRAYGLRESEVTGTDKTMGGRVAIRSPIGGTVVARSITLGQAVERATDAFKVVNLQKLWVLLDLYEKDLGKVRVGQAVEIRTEAYRGEVFRAKVAYVTPILDDKTRTAAVRIALDNPGGKLRPGQFVTARILGNSGGETAVARHEGIVVSRQAIVVTQGKSCVFVATADGGFERRLVELGDSGGGEIEVISGLKEGEAVAIDGAFLLKAELAR